MPKYKFTFSKPADMIIEIDTIEADGRPGDLAIKVCERRLLVMRMQIESMEEMKEE